MMASAAIERGAEPSLDDVGDVCTLCSQILQPPPRCRFCKQHLKPKGFKKTRSNVTLLKSWGLRHQVTSLCMDPDAEILYIACANQDTPIQYYNMEGKFLGNLSKRTNLRYARLALDIKRDSLLALVTEDEPMIVIFKKDSNKVKRVKCEEFGHLNDVTHHVGMDVYIVTDIGTRCVYYVHPVKRHVVTLLPALSDAEMRGNVRIACDTSGSHAHWATSDWNAGIARVFSADGECVWRNAREELGVIERSLDTPAGVYVDVQGRVLLVDSMNKRVIILERKEEDWRVGRVEENLGFGLGYPKDITMVTYNRDDNVIEIKDESRTPQAVIAFHEGAGSSYQGLTHIGLVTGI